MTGRRGCVAFLMLLATSLGSAAEPAPPGWKAGAARVKITPEKLMWMSGYSGGTKPAEGTLIDLWAKRFSCKIPRASRPYW